MNKFNTIKIEKELKKISKDAGIVSDSGAITLIVNQMEMYNYLLNDFENGDESKIYVIYQMSSSIFKQLAEYNVLPTKKKNETKNNSSFMEMINKVERRN